MEYAPRSIKKGSILLISQLAQQSGLSKDTIRFYEKIGLIPTPKRLANGYRDYEPNLVQQLTLLAHAKTLGFSLNEIKQLAKQFFSNQLSPSEMNTVLRQKEQEIDEKILQLQNFKKVIKQTLSGECEFKDMLN